MTSSSLSRLCAHARQRPSKNAANRLTCGSARRAQQSERHAAPPCASTRNAPATEYPASEASTSGAAHNRDAAQPGAEWRSPRASKAARLPKHVAVIPDGNFRWAAGKGLEGVYGHVEGTRALRSVVRACGKLGIPALTVFAFSSENWKRDPTEVAVLLNSIEATLIRDLSDLHAQGVQLLFFGQLHRLPPSLQAAVNRARELTQLNKGLQLSVALSYGGRQDMLHAVQTALRSGAWQHHDSVSEDQISEWLESRVACSAHGPPDLLIRTGGEMRLSNFLLWDMAYTELHFSQKLWPDFREEDFLAAVEWFATRERRFGGRD